MSAVVSRAEVRPRFFSQFYVAERTAQDSCDRGCQQHLAERLLWHCPQPRGAIQLKVMPAGGEGTTHVQYLIGAWIQRRDHLTQPGAPQLRSTPAPEHHMEAAEASVETASWFKFSLCSALPLSPLLPCPLQLSPVNLPQAHLYPGAYFQVIRPKAFSHQQGCCRTAFVCSVGRGSQSLLFQMGRLRPKEAGNLLKNIWC